MPSGGCNSHARSAAVPRVCSFCYSTEIAIVIIFITAARMRRIVLLHSLISFGFNTKILAVRTHLAATLF